MSMREQSSFSRKISLSNFVAITLLGVRALNVPGTTSPFSSLLGPEKYDAWMADGAHSFKMEQTCVVRLVLKSSSGFLEPGKL